MGREKSKKSLYFSLIAGISETSSQQTASTASYGCNVLIVKALLVQWEYGLQTSIQTRTSYTDRFATK